MNCKLHTRRNILSLLASISFLIFLDAGEDSSLLGLLVLGPKGDHHGEVWLYAAARHALVVGVSVHIHHSSITRPRSPGVRITSFTFLKDHREGPREHSSKLSCQMFIKRLSKEIRRFTYYCHDLDMATFLNS